MAEGNKIRHGIEHWRTNALEKAGGDENSVSALALLGQLESMVELLHECEHDGGTNPVSSTHIVCFKCKWVQYTPTGEWEPLGFGR